MNDHHEYAFIDESGDPSLEIEKDGVSNYYVIGAILISGVANLANCRKEANQIRLNHFGIGEIKSSSVGKNIKKRKTILNDLNKLPLRFYAFVLDKKNIYKDSGLKFKKSYIKYSHGRLYKRLYKSFTNLHIVADEHGHPEFMDSFKLYLEKNYQQNLFDHKDFSFSNSNEEILIQIADFLSGSVQRIFSKKDPRDTFNEFSDITIMLEKWPPSSENLDYMEGLESKEKFDNTVAQQGIMQARSFIDSSSSGKDEDIESQVETVRYLLYKYELNPYDYISTKEILNHLNQTRDAVLKEHRFRSHVIARLRNSGVIIASGSNGYKLPSCSKDMDTYVSLVNTQTIPYLKRLSFARRQLILATKGNYEIIPKEKYPELLKCIESIEDDDFEQLH
jgi:biotin operon repressor